jgi:hypothetical protein
MSKRELVVARDYLEWRFKDPSWKEKFGVKAPGDRVDPDLDYIREWAHRLDAATDERGHGG